jgi:PAS domain S-box-containing protein
MRVHALRETPLALSFAVAAFITTEFGLGPGLASVAATATILYVRFLLPGSSSPYAPGALIRLAVASAVGTIIVLFCHRQRVISLQLRTALESLRERTAALAQAQRASNSAAWSFVPEDDAVRWAEGGTEIFGLPAQECWKLDALLNFVHPEDRRILIDQILAAQRSSSPFRIEFRVLLSPGELRWLEAQGTLSPGTTQWSGLVLDITSRKKVESALLRAEKLAAVGRLSATVAHEINNPLEALTNLHFLIAGEDSLSPEVRGYLDAAEGELQRLESIARHTLTFVRPRLDTGPADAVPIATSAVAMFQSRCRSRGGIIRLIAPAQASVLVPADELRQILTNLLSNACDALENNRGIVEVSIEQLSGTLRVTVRDTGSGILAEHRDRIFEPFFTTKNEIGTGIGLWVTRELIEKCGGAIRVSSEADGSPFTTTFIVDLPSSIERPAA